MASSTEEHTDPEVRNKTQVRTGPIIQRDPWGSDRDENICDARLAACPADPDRYGGWRGRGHLSVLGADGFHPGRAGGVFELSAGPARYGPPAARRSLAGRTV